MIPLLFLHRIYYINKFIFVIYINNIYFFFLKCYTNGNKPYVTDR